MSETPSEEQAQFNAAMERFERQPVFRRTKQAVAFVVVGLQLVMLALLWREGIGIGWQVLVAFLGYVLADFVNGWIHLYMDNSANYASATGPFFASFHLHHRTPRYRVRPAVFVYCVEAGSKLWLAIVEILIVTGIIVGWVAGALAHFMFYFAVFSCVAEVSHYFCHAPQPVWARWLARARILLPSRYHARHHREDNVQYAFLNGMTDPLLDWIARRYYAGYKTTTDTHYAYYRGPDTSDGVRG